MEQVEIRFYVPKSTAIIEGRCMYGSDVYKPSDTELSMLDAATRAYVATLDSRRTFTLATGQPPTWPNIADSIRADLQEVLARRATEAAEREERILACLAEPDDKWLSLSRYYGNAWQAELIIPAYGCRTEAGGCKDPRIVARLEALQPQLQDLKAEAARRNEQDRATEKAREASAAAERAAAEQAKAEALVNLVSWCRAHGPAHLQRGATDEYDVTTGCIDFVAQSLVEMLGQFKVTIIREDSSKRRRYGWEERESPSLHSFEVLDTCTKAIGVLEHPTSITLDVERIQRVSFDPDPSDSDVPLEHYTGVVITVQHPACATRYLIVRAE